MSPKQTSEITIKAPSLQTVEIEIEGISEYVQHRFPEKARRQMHEKHEAGDKAKSKNKRESRDFDADFHAATYHMEGGGYGIPCAAFRAAMISACRSAGFVMTRAKQGIVWTEPDGRSTPDGTALVRITKGEPEYFEMYAPNDNGSIDLRVRPRWAPGWTAVVRIKFDSDMIDAQSIANLLMRAGMQVGIGEGRNDSKNSCGQGWGFFQIKERKSDEQQQG